MGSRQTSSSFRSTDPVTLTESAEGLDRLLDGRLARLIEDGEIRGRARVVSPSRTRTAALGARRVGAAGAGKGRARRRIRSALPPPPSPGGRRRSAARSIAWLVEGKGDLSPAEQARAIVEGTLLGEYENGRWKTNGDDARRPRAPRPLRPRRGRGSRRGGARRPRRVLGEPLPRPRQRTGERADARATCRLGRGDGRRQPGAPLRGPRPGGDPRRRDGRLLRRQPGKRQPAAPDHADATSRTRRRIPISASASWARRSRSTPAASR